MSLEALHLVNPSTAPSLPAAHTQTLQEPTEPPTREWLRLGDVHVAFLQGAPNSAPWTPVTLVVLSTPDWAVTPPRSLWYLMFVPKDASSQQSYTIDITTRPWRASADELSFMFSFHVGDIGEGNATRYLVKTGSKRSFDYILSYAAYIRACRVGAIVETP